VTRADVELTKEVLAQVRAELGPEALANLGAVQVTAKPRPDAQDLKRGAHGAIKATFYGVGLALGEQGSIELPDPTPAAGEITLFLDNIAPVTPERVRICLLHEYMHALGHDEETIQGLGLFLEDGPVCTPF